MEPKLFKDYDQLIEQLLQKGMLIPDKQRALRKLAQVGYYRLGTFWYSCRQPSSNSVKPYKHFLPKTDFNEIFKLYLLDKRLRLLLMDAIERIEVALKTKIAHELGRYSPLAHLEDAYINPKQLKDFNHKGIDRNTWKEWLKRQQDEISRCKEDFIEKYKKKNKTPPIWVAVETWSFGTISKYFELLKKRYQNKVAQELGIDNSKNLVRWLQAISILRNRCAHHTRVWNQLERNPLNLPTNSVIFSRLQEFNSQERKRIFVLILIIDYLVKNIGPSSHWLSRIIKEIEQPPNLPIDIYAAMGINQAKLLSSLLNY